MMEEETHTYSLVLWFEFRHTKGTLRGLTNRRLKKKKRPKPTQVFYEEQTLPVPGPGAGGERTVLSGTGGAALSWAEPIQNPPLFLNLALGVFFAFFFFSPLFLFFFFFL